MNVSDGVTHRGWEYEQQGDYHKNLDLNWSYAPTYLRKMTVVRRFINALPLNAAILDMGCGEGVLVEEFRDKRNIRGVDLHYESDIVERGDVRATGFADSSLDAILLLDVLEHLAFEDQPRCLAEIRRLLKPNGAALLAIPNLAHFNSRFTFALRGRLDRTDIETNHIGERPMLENQRLIEAAGLRVTRRFGITLTMPFVYRRLICAHAARLRPLHDALEPFARRYPGLAMLTIFVCRRAQESP